MNKQIKFISLLRRTSALCLCFLILSGQFYGLCLWAGYQNFLVLILLRVFEISILGSFLCFVLYLLFFIYKFIK